MTIDNLVRHFSGNTETERKQREELPLLVRVGDDYYKVVDVRMLVDCTPVLILDNQYL